MLNKLVTFIIIILVSFPNFSDMVSYQKFVGRSK